VFAASPEYPQTPAVQLRSGLIFRCAAMLLFHSICSFA
jgi:hypothetical protein